MTEPALETWKNRIVGTDNVAPDQLVANPKNWRTHPGAQRDALRGSLATVGWVQQVMVNQRTGNVVDGHARVEEALSKGEPTVPVLYVDISEEEEALVLATLDPISAMAERDQGQLHALLSEISVPLDFVGLFGADGGWAVDVVDPPDLPDSDRDGFRQMSFIVTDAQAEEIHAALSRAKAVGPFVDDNANSNGNALARIAEAYRGVG